ncbi:hypothetical protein FSB08_31660 [Paraburkholderia sp. JPY432]|uniref:hypothetical protein n=1 Tax=Paraburkholderia TaxID=1822464 RepID=UPI0015962801|nr:hypothetical protein [Paraburkholderia youngii]NVH76949.1 hypothetical protein [Paraburkholderia youngii]
MAIGSRGGEGAHFGGEDAGFGRYGRRGEADALHDGTGNRLPGVVTAQEEGGRIAGHDYDRDGIDLSEQKIYPDEYLVVSGCRLTGWQSLSDRHASRAAWRDAHRVRTLFILVGLVALGVAVSLFAFSQTMRDLLKRRQSAKSRPQRAIFRTLTLSRIGTDKSARFNFLQGAGA